MWTTRRTGLRVTTLNWHLTADEASYIVADCDAKVLFEEPRTVKLDAGSVTDWFAPNDVHVYVIKKAS